MISITASLPLLTIPCCCPKENSAFLGGTAMFFPKREAGDLISGARTYTSEFKTVQNKNVLIRARLCIFPPLFPFIYKDINKSLVSICFYLVLKENKKGIQEGKIKGGRESAVNRGFFA